MAGLRNQQMPFMFEVWNAGALAERFILPINPEEYRLQHQPKANVIQTKGGAWEDNFGNGLPTISIRGTFGYLGSLPGGGGRTVNGVQLCGQELFKELERIFLEFYALFGADGNAGTSRDRPTLRFYNFTDEHYWVAQVKTFDLLRSIQRRNLYQYSLQLVGLAAADSAAAAKYYLYGDAPPDMFHVAEADPLIEALEDIPEPPVEEVTFWEQALEGYRWVSGKVSDAINDLHDLKSDLTTIQQAVSSFRQDLSDLIAAPFEVVETAFATVDTILDTVVSLGDIPHEFVVQMRETKRTLCHYRIVRHLFQEPPDPGVNLLADSLDVTSPEIMTAPLPSGVLGVVTMRNPETTLFASGEEAESRAVGEVVAAGNDTLQSIAHRFLGDASQWRRLALLNDLAAPYDLTAGQKILVPSLSTARVALLDQTVWESKAYGTDEALDREGEHNESGTGDLETASGLANLAMQLQHRLNTLRGELTEVGHPTYGCLLPTFIGKASTDYWIERAKVEAKAAILEDPRVAGIANLTFTETNGTIYIEGDVRPVNRASAERVRLLVG